MYSIARRLAGWARDNDLPVERNIPAAIDLFQRCIDEQNHVGAMFDLAAVLAYECEHEDDTQMLRAIALLERGIVESDDSEAKFCLADVIRMNRDTNTPRWTQFVRIVELYESCIEQANHRQAMFQLAEILAQGAPGVEKDVSRALQLYESSIDGLDHAQLDVKKVVEIIISGADGVEENVSHAFRIVETYLDASFDVYDVSESVCLRVLRKRTRFGFPCDATHAVSLLEMCIDKLNHAQAMVILADILLFGAPQVSRDIDRGLQLCATALEVSDEQDLYGFTVSDIVGKIINEQWWESENVPLAVLLCELCIEKSDDDRAMVFLAEILMTGGVNIEKDVGRAIQLCEKSLHHCDSWWKVTWLAANVADGTCGMTRDVQAAVQLFEMCIDQKNDGSAMMMLAEIFMSGAPGIDQDVDRAISLCNNYLNPEIPAPEPCDKVIDLARKVAYQRFGITGAVQVAMQLCEMCIEKRDNSGAMILLAELVMTGARGIEKDIDHGMKLCEQFLDASGLCYEVTDLAKKIADGTSEIDRDIQLAIQLCELCIEKKNDTDAILTLAEILMTGVAGVERDVDRGMELCKQYLYQNGRTERLSDFARLVAYGRYGKPRDVRLAIDICEICVEKMNDAEAMIILGEILMSEDVCSWKDVGRATQVWKYSLHAKANFVRIAKAVREIAFGAGRMTINVPLAIEVCELFVSAGCANAMITLGEILLIEGDGDEAIARGLQLCQKSLDSLGGVFGIYRLAETAKRVMTYGKCGISGNAQLAVQLVGMYINMLEMEHILPDYLITTAEIFVAAATNSSNIERAVHLCQVAIDRDIFGCVHVAQVARNVAFGANGMKRNTALAIRLCNMGIEKKETHAFMTLAEIYIAGTPEVEKNVSYAMELCEQSITKHRHKNLVPCLARNVASGTEWMEGDAALGVKLCEMCVKKRRDVRAMVVLSEIYVMGGCNVEMDIMLAHEWYEQAAGEGWLLGKYGRHGSEYVHTLPKSWFVPMSTVCEKTVTL